MAEYYAVLKRAVGSLDPTAVEPRRAVYDKARNALIGQLKAVDPPLTTAEISRQRLELEEAIRKVEREAASAPARPAAPPPSRPTPQIRPLPTPPPAAEAEPQPEHSPQDVFRRAIQDAEHRGSAAGAIERAAMAIRAEADSYSAPPPPPSRHEEPPPRRAEPAYPPAERLNAEPRLAPEYDQAWEPEQDREPEPPPGPRERAPAIDRRDRSTPPPPRNGRRRGYLEEDDQEVFEREPRKSRLPTILLLVLIVAMLGGLGALAWSQRAVVTDLLASFDGESSGTASSEPPPAPAGEEGAPVKDTDRLLEGEPAKEVRTVAPAADAPTEEGIPLDAGDTVDTETAAVAPPAAPATVAEASGDALVAQKAILYEEPIEGAGSGVTAINAAVTWRYVENGPTGPEVEASLTVPEREMKIRFALHKNTDQTLPASHLIEVVVDIPADFPGKGIKTVPRIVMKPTEEARGQALVGAPAKVTDGFFWIALSADGQDVISNLGLLRERNWIDLPFVYETGQRAILTFEKGTPGERVFQQAVAAWGEG
jgi:hypothetical protein